MLSHDDPQRVVRAGDRLVQVNAAQGDPGAMLYAAQTEEVKLLTVVRDVPKIEQHYLRWERNCVLSKDEHAVQHALLGDKLEKVEEALSKLPKQGDATLQALRADAEARVRYLKSLGDDGEDPKLRQMAALELMDALEDKTRNVERLERALELGKSTKVSPQLVHEAELRVQAWQRLQAKKVAKAGLEATLRSELAPAEHADALGASLDRAKQCGLGGELLREAQRAFDEARRSAEREADRKSVV